MSDGRSKIDLASYKGKRLNPIVKVLLSLVLLGALVFGTLLGQVLSGAHDDVSGSPQVMIILGCQLHDWGPSIMLQDRLDKALEYLEDHPDMTVVVSGGQGENEPATEAQGMADYLADHGFARENIILETQSHNTFQNMTYSAKHLKEAGWTLRRACSSCPTASTSHGPECWPDGRGLKISLPWPRPPAMCPRA